MPNIIIMHINELILSKMSMHYCNIQGVIKWQIVHEDTCMQVVVDVKIHPRPWKGKQIC